MKYISVHIIVILILSSYNALSQPFISSEFKKIKSVTDVNFHEVPYIRILDRNQNDSIINDSIQCYDSANKILKYLYKYVNVPKGVDSSYSVDVYDQFDLAYRSLLDSNKIDVSRNFVTYIINTDKRFSCVIFHEGLNFIPERIINKEKLADAILINALGGVAALATGYGFYTIPSDINETQPRSLLTLIIIDNLYSEIVYKDEVKFDLNKKNKPIDAVYSQMSEAFNTLKESISKFQDRY